MMAVMGRDETLDVLEAVQRRAEALASADSAALRELLHPDFRWTSHRGQVFDRETYIENNTSGSLVWRRQTVAEVTVSVVDDTAVVFGIVTDEVERAGFLQTFRMPMTQAWVRRRDRWICLAGHAGPLL
jgi:hypothetical protein